MTSPRSLCDIPEDIQLLKRRQQRLEHSLIEMQQQIHKLQMSRTITEDFNVQCVPPPDSSLFNWVATGVFLMLGISAVICARKA